MTRLELLRTGTEEQIAELLCDEHEQGEIIARDRGVDLDTCDSCPAQRTCRRGHNGFLDWLTKEIKQ